MGETFVMRSTMPNPSTEVLTSFVDDSKPPASSGMVRYTFRTPTIPGSKTSQVLREKSEFPRSANRPTQRTRTPDEIADAIELAIPTLGYPLQNVHCQSDGETLFLVGRTSRYYFAQVALTRAMALAGQRRVICEIEIRPN
jgi:hypothetical protein